MKVFQELTLTGQPHDLDAFINHVVVDHGDWGTAHALEIPNYVALEVPVRICAAPSTLYLFQDEHRSGIKVTNIVPVMRHAELTVDQYNTILQAFYCEFVEAGAFGSLHAELTPESIFIEDRLSPGNMELLKHFAQFANKGTGSTHPQDYKRWLAFISARARDQEILDTNLLQDWLVDQGWPSDIASTLVSEYRFGVDLIQQLSAADTVQDSVSATR